MRSPDGGQLCKEPFLVWVLVWVLVRYTIPFLKRYRVAAGSAQPLHDYLHPHDSSIIHDYRLPPDPSYSTITVTSSKFSDPDVSKSLGFLLARPSGDVGRPLLYQRCLWRQRCAADDCVTGYAPDTTSAASYWTLGLPL
eukprot:COSAG02_NODE_6872_length_3314_cov_59.485226_4_plen_139_part_00